MGSILAWKEYSKFRRFVAKIFKQNLPYNRFVILFDSVFPKLNHATIYSPVIKYTSKEMWKLQVVRHNAQKLECIKDSKHVVHCFTSFNKLAKSLNVALNINIGKDIDSCKNYYVLKRW